MPRSDSPDSDHSYDNFNDPPGPTQDIPNRSGSNNKSPDTQGGNESLPRPKRIACVLCRKRKLKCDGTKPSCGTCSRLGHNCAYDEVRKKSGPKRGYVKLLEARLKQVENLLETHATTSEPQAQNRKSSQDLSFQDASAINLSAMPNVTMQGVVSDTLNDLDQDSGMDFGISGANDFSWDIIALGLDEALPNQDVIDELNQVYFDKIHPSVPMINRTRFLMAMNLAPHLRPAVCLRYAMWTHAASVIPKYASHAQHFYNRSRKYIEQDEMKGHGEGIISLYHAQTWNLLSTYEFKMMYFPRAWMSVGRASRISQMMGLHRQDRIGLDVKQTLPPPGDWVDREERRRTFWMAYCQDRYASIGTGWPLTFDEQDILTNLPASEQAFQNNQAETTGQLCEVMRGEGLSKISAFSGIILLATLYGRNLTHLHRPQENDNDHDLNGEFWKRHRKLDNIILQTSLSLPTVLRIPQCLPDPNAIFINLNIHTATICLHQAAIFKADKNRLFMQISSESKRRCLVAADQVTNIMKMISHLDLSTMNPFLAFNLYVAARVFVQYLKSRRDDSAAKSSLQFLLSAMQVLKDHNPLTESFMVQLDVDLEGSGLDISRSSERYGFGHQPIGEIPKNTGAVRDCPFVEIRETQNPCLPHHQKVCMSLFPNRTPEATPQPDQAATRSKVPPVAQPNPDPPQFSFKDVFGNYPDSNGVNRGFVFSPPNSGPDDHSSRSHSNQPTPASNSSNPPPYTTQTSPHLTGDKTFPFTTQNIQPPKYQSNMTDEQYANQISGRNGSVSDQIGMTVNEGWNQATSIDNHSHMMGSLQGNDMNFGGIGLTPGATGMTPLPDEIWQTVGIGEGNDWMFGNYSNPQ